MTAAASAPTDCRNCRAALPREPAPLFCWRCGQETKLHEPTFLEFVHEFVGHYVALEGPLWRTLRALVVSPGRLTAEYFAGRRRRYVLPLRLYLSASFIFFLVVKVLGAPTDVHIIIAPGIDSHGRPITASADPAAYQEVLRKLQACIDVAGSCSWFDTTQARLALKAESFSAHPEVLVQRLVSLAPYVVFALLPVFAAIVMLAYRSRRLNYGGHFVFSLHSHAFWFLALTVLAFVPGPAALAGLTVLLVHSVLSLHRVHGGGWLPTLARAALVVVLYVAALGLALVALSIGSVMVS